MKIRVLIIVLTVVGCGFGWNTGARAIGCISGGLAGGVAGHMAHHGVLGALGGCIAGHEYNKHQQRAASQNQNAAPYQPPVDRGTQQTGPGQND